MSDKQETRYRLPQEHGIPDPEAESAALSGDVPPADPEMAGESAPGEPSRAEIFALNPELAGEDGVSAGSPTMPEGPDDGLPYVAGAPKQGKTEPLEPAPPPERPDWASTPAERHDDMEPPKGGDSP
ncbi:MAG: hypothetical protein ACM3S1_12840 [Hyphomicrobiales bacterium]